MIATSKVSKDLENSIIERLGGKPIDIIELNNRLSLKADRKRLDLIDEIKVDKVEIENYTGMFIHNNKQMINLLGILIEYLQLTVPKGSIADNAPTTKRGNILKRMYNLFQAVNKNEEMISKGKLNCLIVKLLTIRYFA